MRKLSILFLLLLALGTQSCKHFTLFGKKHKKQVAAADTAKKKEVKEPLYKPFKEIITAKAVSQEGLLTVHKVDTKWYFEIPDSILGREILAITRFSKTPAGVSFYAGEEVNEQTMYWEKAPNKKILLRVSILINKADSTHAISKAVKNSNTDPIIAAFEIKTLSPKGNAVIDVTDFFNGDNQSISVPQQVKQMYNLTGLAGDRSYIQRISTYPINTEIRTLKTYNANTSSMGNRMMMVPGGYQTGAVTVELNTSFILLPKIPMRKRLFDPRVGFFADEYSFYSDHQEKVENSKFITRWRLEPKPEDMEKFKRGELVEPQKPIVYYIDPAVPKQWRPYLIQGINDWQKAFERAGFKNAILGKEWPENDSTMSLEDARYSVIRYFASPINNAYGPHVHDPRSGEIIESHLGWYHNIMNLLHNWYMIQAAMSDTTARKMKFDEELMGQLIRFVSSHEIGHTLGLRHNMGSSSTVPVEKLRDRKWVEAYGHTPSIMDYARFNYVAQPEDHVGRAGLFPRIGDYDMWAIQWGYRPIPDAKDEEEERKILNKIVIDSLATNKRLWFGSGEMWSDTRCLTEDLGDDNMKADEYGIRNLKQIIVRLPEWTKEEADQYKNLTDMYSVLKGQYFTYIGHVINNIGGQYINIKSIEQKGDVYGNMPKDKSKEAIDFLNRNFFHTPNWIANPSFSNKVSSSTNRDFSNSAGYYISSLVRASLLTRLSEMSGSSSKAYSVNEYLTDLEKCIYEELSTRKPVDYYRRSLQKAYVNELFNAVFTTTNEIGGTPMINESVAKTDVPSIVKVHLASLKSKIDAASASGSDAMTRIHYKDLSERIGVILNKRK
ncbi:zinc-dependent metalloprotease [Parabacteroides sp. FAFU027]|uniref:zinc-dependent metalloprotease n=1 Tax=Parabacteroides sp. FAFU027 TaxID=2922715 RepID=UPI001FAED4A8|nr:zinc-dependent metalloprotease [Parabacteroides sp. FAFU027]